MKIIKQCPFCRGRNVKVYRKGEDYKIVCKDCKKKEAKLKKAIRTAIAAIVKAIRI